MLIFRSRAAAPAVVSLLVSISAQTARADSDQPSQAAAPATTLAGTQTMTGTQTLADTQATAPTAPGTATSGQSSGIETVIVTARHLNDQRSQIETQTGASTYTIDAAAIAAAPGGDNVQLNQVLLQAPDVVQDSFGQLHVRGDHNDLQYRLNGIILPEGISVFSQTLSPRLISSLDLITGALPAEYGLRTAGIIDLTTSSGLLQPGGNVSVYGGSHSTIEPSGEYGGSDGNFSYYVMGDMLRNDLGIESPDGSSDPLHDHSDQVHGFGYFDYILDPQDRVSLILGTSDDAFQVPNQRGLQPAFALPDGTPYPLDDNGTTDYLSNDLDETQHELAEYAIVSWQHSAGDLNWQSSLSTRYTSLHFAPDWVGDLLYNGLSQDAFKADTALASQTDAAYTLDADHTLRAGVYLQHDASTSNTTTQALCMGVDVPGICMASTPVYLPQTVFDHETQSQEIESVYLQDEWKVFSQLTLNYGLRFDNYNAYSGGNQLSPRVNFVWQLPEGTTVHGGYSKYFTPPPFELVSSADYTRFYGTSALPIGSVTQDSPPVAESANYYDLGVQQKLWTNLTLGVDGYYEQADNLIDEGQFGAPIILTPFNYRYGHLGGVEFTGNYSVSNLSVYGNVAVQSAKGKDVESSQFSFTQDQLAYIADNYIHLDHEERVSASGGVSYELYGTRLSTDLLFGTGLRQDLIEPDGFAVPNGDHTPSYLTVNLGASHAFMMPGGPLTLRFDIINATDKMYQIRSGSGVGVFAPQWGARRGFFFGVSKDFGV
ncbi:MAG TPA: TonB-dependent receptor [Steroidobacteraceae bacterium]|nr:TonB-dependent receptor [Steroidobacteraceae bacterium]